MEAVPFLFLGLGKYLSIGVVLIFLSYYLLINKKDKPDPTKTTTKGIIGSIILAIGIVFVMTILSIIYMNLSDLKYFYKSSPKDAQEASKVKILK